MTSPENSGSTDQDAASTNNQTTGADTYIHLLGMAAIHFNKATNELEVYAYNEQTLEVVRSSKLPFGSDQGDPWIILSDMHLVAELPTVDLDARLTTLTTGNPHLKVVVEAVGSSDFHAVMTPQDPPVNTNRVTPRSR